MSDWADWRYNQALAELPTVLKVESAYAQDDIAEVYEDEVKSRLEGVDATESRNYVDHVTVQEAYRVDRDRIVEIRAPEAQTYSDLIEAGHRTRRGTTVPGRWPVAQALASADSKVVSVLDRMGEAL